MRPARSYTLVFALVALACHKPEEDEPLDCNQLNSMPQPVCELAEPVEFPASTCPKDALLAVDFSGPLAGSGLVASGGNWEVCDGRLAGGSGSNCPGSILFNLQSEARFGDGVAIDVDVHCPSKGWTFGVMWTMQDEDHGQMAWFGAEGAQITRNPSGGTVTGHGAEYIKVPFERQTDHHVRVEIEAGEARLLVDGVAVGSAPTEYDEGSVGLWAYLDVVQFDNLCVTAL